MREQRAKNPVSVFIQNGSWLSLEKLIRIGLSVLVGVLVARFLGPDLFGKLNFIITISIVLESISVLGLETILIKKIHNNSYNQFGLLTNAIIVRILAVMVLTPISILLLVSVVEDQIIVGLSYFILGTLFFRPFDLIEAWFQFKEVFKYSVLAKLFSIVIYSLLRIVIIYFFFDIYYLALAFFLEGLIRSAVLIYLYRKKGGLVELGYFNLNNLKDLLKPAIPLLFSAMTVMIYMKIDIIMLGLMIDTQEVGIYTAAVRVSELLYSIPVIIVTAIFPIMLKYKDHGQNIFNMRFQQLYDVITPVMILLIVFFSVFSGDVLSALFGSKFDEAHAIFRVHVWSGLFISFAVIRSKWLIIEGKQKYEMYSQIIGAVSNIILNLFLIKTYGGLGAAWATLFSYFFASTLSSIIFNNLHSDLIFQLRSLMPFKRLYLLLKGVYAKDI